MTLAHVDVNYKQVIFCLHTKNDLPTPKAYT